VKCCPLKIRVFNEEGIAITIVSDRSCGGCSLCYHRCPNNAIKLVKFRIRYEIENKKSLEQKSLYKK
jgi:translation initiation factor RLI1